MFSWDLSPGTSRCAIPNHPGGGIDVHCPRWGVGLSECQENKTLCYWRYLGTPDQANIVVVSNFDHADHEFDVPFPSFQANTRFPTSLSGSCRLPPTPSQYCSSVDPSSVSVVALI